MEGSKFNNIENIRNTITGRTLQEYAAILEVSPKFLDGKNVLNFGCGGANLAKDMQEIYKKDASGFIDLDVEYDPVPIEGKGYSLRDTTTLEKLREIREEERKDSQLTLPIIKEHENKLIGVENRKLVQYDGENIPFKDDAFDVTLALWSTYQIDDWKKPKIYDELLRVSKILHVGPVDQRDIDIFDEVCKKYDSKIILKEKFNDSTYDKLDSIDNYKTLAEADFTNYRPITIIERETNNGILSANSFRTSKIIIIRNSLLK